MGAGVSAPSLCLINYGGKKMYSAYYSGSYSRRRVGSKTYPTHCSYCGKNVYYYEKKHKSGRTSKVFFDALGKPWPLHRCREYLNGRHGHK